MLTERIVFKNVDGSCGIIVPVGSIESCIVNVPEGCDWRITDVSKFPQDRIFRNAWTDDNPTDTVDIDMPRAKLIAHDKRRVARDKKFRPLDIEATIPDRQAEAEAKRQVIRDEDAQLQIDIDNATTPEELKALLNL